MAIEDRIEPDLPLGGDGSWPLRELAERDDDLGHLSRDVGGTLEELAQITADFSCGSARSANAVSHIGEEIVRLRGDLKEVADRTGSLRASSDEAAASAADAADLGEQLSLQSARGLEVIGPLIDAFGEISEHAVRRHEMVENLAANELTRIGQFSAIIERIADQTKLLALNAAQTAQIRETVSSTQAQMHQVVRAAATARDQSTESAAGAGAGREALERIGGLAGQSDERARQIAALARQQLADVSAIDANMRTIMEGSAEIEAEACSAVCAPAARDSPPTCRTSSRARSTPAA